jgi:ribonuclease P protein subunit POP4
MDINSTPIKPSPRTPASTSKKISKRLLARQFSPDRAEKIYRERVVQRPVGLVPTSHEPDARDKRRALQRKKLVARKTKNTPKPLTAKEKRDSHIYDIPPEGRKYEIYQPLLELWRGYAREVIGDARPVGRDAASKLCHADFHGAELSVVRSRCVSRVGIEGIVVRDTRFAFEVITRSNEVKRTLNHPRSTSVFLPFLNMLCTVHRGPGKGLTSAAPTVFSSCESLSYDAYADLRVGIYSAAQGTHGLSLYHSVCCHHNRCICWSPGCC